MEVQQLATNVPERFVPESMRDELLAAEHLARYEWAGGLAPGRRVLDAGCGTGYGAEMLAAAGAASVMGVDSAAAVVEAARRAPAGGSRSSGRTSPGSRTTTARSTSSPASR